MMFTLLRRFQLPIALSSGIMLTGCATMDPGMISDIASMPGNVQNLIRRPTSAHDVFSKVNSAMAVIATVQRFAALSAMEKQRVEQTVTRKYDGLVRAQKRELAPKYASRKAEVQKRGADKIAQARQKNPNAAAKVEAETKKEVAQVDLEWEKAAKSSVAKNYGTDFAVPVKNSEGKAVVAFASVKDSGVSVSDSSYEVASTAGSLSSSQKIAHSGKTYAVIK